MADQLPGQRILPRRLLRRAVHGHAVQHLVDAIPPADLPRIRLHAVRHTYATVGLASSEGWHEVKVISERLGHASVGITIDTYSHVLPVADKTTAHTLARLILGN